MALGYEDGTLQVLNIDCNRVLLSFKASQFKIRNIFWLKNNQHLISSSNENNCRQKINEEKMKEVEEIAWSLSGKYLAYNRQFDKILILNVKNSQLIADIEYSDSIYLMKWLLNDVLIVIYNNYKSDKNCENDIKRTLKAQWWNIFTHQIIWQETIMEFDFVFYFKEFKIKWLTESKLGYVLDNGNVQIWDLNTKKY